jgi:hypothetical protein
VVHGLVAECPRHIVPGLEAILSPKEMHYLLLQYIIARQSSGGWPAGSAGMVTLSNIVLFLLSYNVSVHRLHSSNIFQLEGMGSPTPPSWSMGYGVSEKSDENSVLRNLNICTLSQ